jgi:hypothetical protein
MTSEAAVFLMNGFPLSETCVFTAFFD